VADVAADDAHRTVSGIVATGGDARYVSCDVADADAVDAMVEGIVATEGRLDVMHANAGLESMRAATEVSLAEWHRVVGVNLTGVFLVCRAGLRHMYRQESGVLVTRWRRSRMLRPTRHPKVVCTR
jgi:NAD(P)-dependent dehydrogenase (short-subunit alcohol dehydrogenase family)